MALHPGARRPGLGVAVVGIALPLGLLPASPSDALTGRSTAVHLMWTVNAAGMPRRTPYTAASPWMPPPPQGKLERSASGTGLHPPAAKAIPMP